MSSNSNRSPWILSGTILLAIVIWMSSALFMPAEESPAAEGSTATAEKPLQEVRVTEQQAEPVARFVTVYGRSEPARSVTLKAETAGTVTAVNAERGLHVETGTALVTIDTRDRREQLRRAEADVEKARIQYDAEKRLQGDSLSSDVRIAEAMAGLEAAKAELKRIRIDLDKTSIKAPFAGSLNTRMVEVGDYVKVADPIGEFVELDTLIITGSVSETERANLEVGKQASARLITGQTASGKIRYIAPVAEETTRTFLVEIEVDNSDHALPAGVTAEIDLPIGTGLAHRISPAILALDKNGDIGVKVVDDNDRVQFMPVTVVKSTDNGIWIDGLGSKARIITVGQGFVRDGDRVRPVVETTTPAAALAGKGEQ
ncbi:MAG: efflux RND transporter periplasmic adaptor subunit [Gammaproteobacteria bacterium]|nr:efflux RND transporter periplasmic adaptor subunit [Gammaproteobacteria bacterium]